jgi:hypothetical protein
MPASATEDVVAEATMGIESEMKFFADLCLIPTLPRRRHTCEDRDPDAQKSRAKPEAEIDPQKGLPRAGRRRLVYR